MLEADASSRSTETASSSWINSFTCINSPKTSTSWPVRDIFNLKGKEFPPDIQPTVYIPTARSKFRDSIMNQAQQLELSKQMPKTTVARSGKNGKRKSKEAVTPVSLDSEEPFTKRLKKTKPNMVDYGGQIDDHKSRETAVASNDTTDLSAKTKSKLDAFRFSAPCDQASDCQESTSKATETDPDEIQMDRGTEIVKPNSKYVLKDHSSRLIESGKEEMAKSSHEVEARLQHSAYVDCGERQISRCNLAPQGTPGNHDHVEFDVPHSQSRYKLKDHSSRLIQAGISEMHKQLQVSRTQSQVERGTDLIQQTTREDDSDPGTAPFTQYKTGGHASRLITAVKPKTNSVICNNHEHVQIISVASTDSVNTVEDTDDLEDVFFEDTSLDDSVFEHETSTHTTELTEMDEMDDSLFEEMLAEDEAEWQDPPTSAQVEVKCFSSDSLSSPAHTNLMLPPKIPLPAAPPKNVFSGDSLGTLAPPEAGLTPFLRPPSSTMVTLPSEIPDLNPAGRVTTCFRLAELFRESSSASPPSAIELFAKVIASVRNRDSTSQSLTFADLFFPQRPPYVYGAFAKCCESELFDDDSRVFLKAVQGGKSILARAIVRPKVPGKQLLWNRRHGFHAGEETFTGMEVEVLSIYTCTLEDIEYTKGIVMPEPEVHIKQEGEKEEFFRAEKKRKFSPLRPVDWQSAPGPALRDISSNLPSSPTTKTGNSKSLRHSA